MLSEELILFGDLNFMITNDLRFDDNGRVNERRIYMVIFLLFNV